MTPNERAYIEATPTVHDLIIVAIKELEKHEQLPGYEINMALFHSYDKSKDTCYLCLGGAFMAGAFPGSRKKSYMELTESTDTSNRMSALDSFRLGQVEGGLSELDIQHHINDFSICSYDIYNPSLFKTQML